MSNIKICMGSSCFARGNKDNLDLIEKYLRDNKLNASVSLDGSFCEGKCAAGPNLKINGKLVSGADPSVIEDILDETFKKRL